MKVSDKPIKKDNELPCKYLGMWISITCFFATCFYNNMTITDEGYSIMVDVKMADGYKKYSYDGIFPATYEVLYGYAWKNSVKC